VSDRRVAKLADVIVKYSLDVQPDELVTIEATTLAAPLVHELYARILQAGGQPLPRIAAEGLLDDRLALGTDAQLDWIAPRLVEDAEKSDARISVLSDFNTRSRTQIDPSRQARVAQAVRPYRQRMFEREAAGEFRWVVTAYPTNALAQ
jgi:aminopeptidase